MLGPYNDSFNVASSKSDRFVVPVYDSDDDEVPEDKRGRTENRIRSHTKDPAEDSSASKKRRRG